MIYLTAGFGCGIHSVLRGVSLQCGGNLEAFENSVILFPHKTLQTYLGTCEKTA